MRITISAALLLAATPLGCAAPTYRNDWSAYTGPGAEYFQREEYQLPINDDPLEPFNRSMWEINDFFLIRIMAPAAEGWRAVVPDVVRSKLVSAMTNLTFPVRAVNNLLQGEFEDAGAETCRFAVNSTVGVLGLFDPAADWGLEPAPESTGRTLTRWGWRESTFLTLPVMGPTTVRDSVGALGDAVLDPTTYYSPTGVIKSFILGSELVESYKRFSMGAFDAYQKARFAMTTGRRVVYEPDGVVDPDDFATQTLQASLRLPYDPAFPVKARQRRVVIPATGRKLTYELWLQAEPAGIVYVVPGLGSHRLDPQALTIAEMFYQEGFSVVTVSSTFTFDFMESASTVAVPGYAPSGARDLHAAIDAIDRQLDAKYPGRLRARALVGMSLGGFHALFIAGSTNGGHEGLVAFDRIIAINPPVELDYAVDQVDAFFNIPLTMPEHEREEWVARTVNKAARAVFPTSLAVGEMPTFTTDEARFLIGLHFRFALHDVILASQLRENLHVLKTPLDARRRNGVTREILDFSYREYFFAFVAPYYMKRHPDITSEPQLFDRMSLTTLAERFPDDGSVQVFTNANDFVLAPSDLETLGNLLGAENVHVRPEGGHLGTLIDTEAREAIRDCIIPIRREPDGRRGG